MDGVVLSEERIEPLITIVTITYNCREDIENTIQSVLSQTYENIEYIIIDGASSDGTLEVINKYKDKIKTIVSEPDNGIYYAMNKAIKLARGEWINFMNSGDGFVNNNVVKNVFEQPFENASLIYGDTVLVYSDNDSKKLKKARPMSAFWQGMPFNHNSLFCKLELLKKTPFNTFYNVVADSDFIAKCLANNELFYNSNMTINYYLMGGYSSQHRVLRTIERWKLLKEYSFVSEERLNNYYFNMLNQILSIEPKNKQPNMNNLLNNKWCRFGQMSRKERIKTILKAVGKKIKYTGIKTNSKEVK